jgi:uncharacterized membrane protein
MRLLLFAAFLTIVCNHFCSCQTTNDSNASITAGAQKRIRIPNPKEVVDQYLTSEEMRKDSSTTNAFIPDPRLDSIQLAAWKSFFTYIDNGYKHRSRVFSWQLISSCIIFCVVIFLVLCGVYFAWLQFTLALKQMRKERTTAATALATELSASAKELKVSSPVLGVIILVISLLFFYLYLVHVYPITETF